MRSPKAVARTAPTSESDPRRQPPPRARAARRSRRPARRTPSGRARPGRRSRRPRSRPRPRAPQSRMRTRPSSRKASRTTSGPRPASGEEDDGRPRALHVPIASAPRWPKSPAGRTTRIADEQEQVEHFLPRRADHVRADDLDGGDDQAGDQRAGHVAEPAQDDGDVGDQHELEPDRRIDGVDRREEHAGHAHAGDADRPGEREDAAGVDPHERRGGPVLRGRPHDLAGVRPAHEGEERGRAEHGDGEGDELGEVEHRAPEAHDDRVVAGAHEAASRRVQRTRATFWSAIDSPTVVKTCTLWEAWMTGRITVR